MTNCSKAEQRVALMFDTLNTNFCKQIFLFFIVLSSSLSSFSQPDRWQQHIQYNMDASLDVTTNIIKGKQVITYTNNSPDTLNKIFIHLYWNAFQPNSSMDIRSRELGRTELGKDKDGKPVLDWDARVTDRISKLKPEEDGYCKVLSISMRGKELQTKVHETILEVNLLEPILPKSTVVFNTSFECQVPLQIRRSGRNSKEGIQYSISQWYPKMVEYDYQGWNANQYVAREFYGVWGDFDVNLTVDKNYKVGATGVLQNAAAIGWGYDKEGSALIPINTPMRTWKFSAKNVHDFVWAADTSYKHITRKTANGPLLHFIYKNVDSVESRWQKTADTCAMAYPFIAKTFGAYPWPSYSFIQGGDGGMEYSMATLVKSASLGTTLHEWCHSWYQQLMGTNESLYPWMDEGFTTYAEIRTTAWLRHIPDTNQQAFYRGYIKLAKSGYEEPMSTHSDHYNLNYAYSNAAYSKGAVFMAQLGYIVGQKNLDKILLNYYAQWRYKHPNPNDFIRVAEKTSGIELDWYKEYWVYTTKTIDYAIDSLWMNGNQASVRLLRVGKMPMPIDVQITFKDGSKENHYIPLNMMLGEKPADDSIPRKVYPEWQWAARTYIIQTSKPITSITSIEIDPTNRLADVDRRNNKLELKW